MCSCTHSQVNLLRISSVTEAAKWQAYGSAVLAAGQGLVANNRRFSPEILGSTYSTDCTCSIAKIRDDTDV